MDARVKPAHDEIGPPASPEPFAAMASGMDECYIGFMNSVTKQILQKVAGWPEEDQQELAEIAREIEARRAGIV